MSAATWRIARKKCNFYSLHFFEMRQRNKRELSYPAVKLHSSSSICTVIVVTCAFFAPKKDGISNAFVECFFLCKNAIHCFGDELEKYKYCKNIYFFRIFSSFLCLQLLLLFILIAFFLFVLTHIFSSKMHFFVFLCVHSTPLCMCIYLHVIERNGMHLISGAIYFCREILRKAFDGESLWLTGILI